MSELECDLRQPEPVRYVNAALDDAARLAQHGQNALRKVLNGASASGGLPATAIAGALPGKPSQKSRVPKKSLGGPPKHAAKISSPVASHGRK